MGVGVEGKDQRQKKKKQEFCLHLRQIRKTLISARFFFFLSHIILMYLIVH